MVFDTKAVGFDDFPSSQARVIRIDAAAGGLGWNLQCDEQQWLESVENVLTEAIVASQEAIVDLIGLGGGVLLFIVSVSHRPAPARIVVAALHGLVRSIAKEYGQMRVRCNLLVGDNAGVREMLIRNTAITGELIATVEGAWSASGFD